MTEKRKIVLGSASPRRKELLLPFYDLLILPAQVDESVYDSEQSKEFVKRIAMDKWKVVSVNPQSENNVVVTADTVVILEDRLMGKPNHEIEAEEMLRALSGRNHQVLTSVVVGKPSAQLQETVSTDVEFRKLNELEIKEYLKSGEWKGKAGAYGIQGRAMTFVDRIQGSLTSVIGLPLKTTLDLIEQSLAVKSK